MKFKTTELKKLIDTLKARKIDYTIKNYMGGVCVLFKQFSVALHDYSHGHEYGLLEIDFEPYINNLNGFTASKIIEIARI